MCILLSPSGDCLETICVTVAHRLFLRHLGHVIGVKIARRLCLRLGVTTGTAFSVSETSLHDTITMATTEMRKSKVALTMLRCFCNLIAN